MNLHVCEVKAKKPVPKESSQETQSKFAMALKSRLTQRMMTREESPIDQFRYQETTASWNFFIFLIEIEPPAVRKGLQKRQM